MGLPVHDQVKYWGIATAVFLVALWLLGDVLLPFITGAAIAYFVDPVINRLIRIGLSRLLATLLIAILALAVTVIGMLLVVPAVINQAAQLVQIAPELFRELHEFVAERFPDALDADSTLRQSLAGLGDTIQSRGMELLERLVSSARGIISLFIFVIVTPVVAFYLMLDWPRLLARIDELLPRDHVQVIRSIASDIDRAIAGFVRGQITVCLILAAYYATALGLAGLQFGLVIGVVAGLISFIPYIGAIVGGVLAIGLALFQFWDNPLVIGLVVGIFVIGQILEGNFLVPNMVGRSVGLHPVWLLFALSVFGTLFGFAGLLVAVPVAAALGVLVRFAAQQYTLSPLYYGFSHHDDKRD